MHSWLLALVAAAAFASPLEGPVTDKLPGYHPMPGGLFHESWYVLPPHALRRLACGAQYKAVKNEEGRRSRSQDGRARTWPCACGRGWECVSVNELARVCMGVGGWQLAAGGEEELHTSDTSSVLLPPQRTASTTGPAGRTCSLLPWMLRASKSAMPGCQMVRGWGGGGRGCPARGERAQRCDIMEIARGVDSHLASARPSARPNPLDGSVLLLPGLVGTITEIAPCLFPAQRHSTHPRNTTVSTGDGFPCAFVRHAVQLRTS
jgi:hypothetical protein